MAKALDFFDILTKLSHVYSKDIYIINNKYIIGGKETEDETSSSFICSLNDELANVIKEKFENEDFIYIANIKKAKTEYEDNVRTGIRGDIKKTNLENFNKLYESISKVKWWKKLNLTEDQFNDLLKNNNTLELFKDDDENPTVIITKDLLPLVNDKNYENIYYTLDTLEGNIERLIISIDTEWMQIYDVVYYLDIL